MKCDNNNNMKCDVGTKLLLCNKLRVMRGWYLERAHKASTMIDAVGNVKSEGPGPYQPVSPSTHIYYLYYYV